MVRAAAASAAVAKADLPEKSGELNLIVAFFARFYRSEIFSYVANLSFLPPSEEFRAFPPGAPYFLGIYIMEADQQFE